MPRIWWALLPVLVAVGCNRPAATVQGTVRVDGKNVESGSIAFYSRAPGGGPSTGAEIVDGKYAIRTLPGLTPGTNQVRINGLAGTGRKIKGKNGDIQDEIIPIVPPVYNMPDSPLTCEIKPGANVLDFDIPESSGKQR